MADPSNVTTVTGEEALQRLVAGNERFLRGEAVRPAAFCPERAVDLSRAQRPFATVLGCSDSRVPPERVFDAGPGELFVIRVAGNVLTPEIAGSLEYAGAYLRTPLLVVMGHEGCGAVSAALAAKHDGRQFPSRIRSLVDAITPGLPEPDPSEPPERLLQRAIECNVRAMVRRVEVSPEGQTQLAMGARIVGAVYEIETGRVRLLSPTKEQSI